MASAYGAKAKDWSLGSVCYRVAVSGTHPSLNHSRVYAYDFSPSAFTSSIVRLAYTIRFFTSRDVTYIAAQVGMWT